MDFSISAFLKIFLTLIIILDPIGIIPTFLGATAQYDNKTRNKIISRAIFVAAVILFVFLALGNLLLNFFGITPGAFYISGGILFFVISYEMIQNKPRSRTTPDEAIPPQDPKITAVFPIATPLLAGPGMITTIMLQVSSADFNLAQGIMLALSLIIGLCLVFIAMRCGTLILRLIGTTGMFVLEKIMGLILGGLSVQLIYEGLVKLNIVQSIF